MIKFPCTECGACCRRAGYLGLPTLNDGHTCIFLKDNKCSVYNKRPLICNVKAYYNKNLKNSMTKEEWYVKNAKRCNEFIKHDNLDEKYLINIESIETTTN